MLTCQGRLPKALARTLSARGYRRLTPVQRAVLRVATADADLLVSARTGSGKTLAYGLALARRLIGNGAAARRPGGPRALVVTPTRELAAQVKGELGWLFAGTGVRIGCCTGGMDPRAERAALAAGPDVVVGTPGRLRDHLRQGGLVVAGVVSVVLDEADDMLLPDFGADLEALVGALPTGRQMLLFSATIGPRAEALARRFQSGALRIDVGGVGEVSLQAVAVAPHDREAAIVNLLRLHEARAALIFCNRREEVGRMARRLAVRGFRVAALSGALSQPRRAAALAAMREGRARVCVATDVAARGIDLPGLELVLHADLPHSAEVLLHRSGRTGRAGRGGLAVLIVSDPERRRARLLARRAGFVIEWVLAPGPEAVRAEDFERLLAEPALAAPPAAEDAAAAAALLAARSPERVAAALVRLWRAGRPAPEALAGSGRGGGRPG